MNKIICTYVYKCVFTAQPENIIENIPFTNTIKNTKFQELTRNVLKCMKKKSANFLRDQKTWETRGTEYRSE